ncbi:hypothetical protein B0H13DRAFT_1861530, partial [Mycena leptocephala]
MSEILGGSSPPTSDFHSWKQASMLSLPQRLHPFHWVVLTALCSRWRMWLWAPQTLSQHHWDFRGEMKLRCLRASYPAQKYYPMVYPLRSHWDAMVIKTDAVENGVRLPVEDAVPVFCVAEGWAVPGAEGPKALSLVPVVSEDSDEAAGGDSTGRVDPVKGGEALMSDFGGPVIEVPLVNDEACTGLVTDVIGAEDPEVVEVSEPEIRDDKFVVTMLECIVVDEGITDLSSGDAEVFVEFWNGIDPFAAALPDRGENPLSE